MTSSCPLVKNVPEEVRTLHKITEEKSQRQARFQAFVSGHGLEGTCLRPPRKNKLQASDRATASAGLEVGLSEPNFAGASLHDLTCCSRSCLCRYPPLCSSPYLETPAQHGSEQTRTPDNA